MGFNKFKHLPKPECCECIKAHLLPHRSCDDIKKQLSSISNSEQRQNSLKDLLRKQKQLNTLKNNEFNKNVHYKAPIDQLDCIEDLPSMYTVRYFLILLNLILLNEDKAYLKDIVLSLMIIQYL
jgi:hypothetical protein